MPAAGPAESAAGQRSELAAEGQAVFERLRAKHRAREAALSASRDAVRASANAIRAAHRGEGDAARSLLEEAERHLAEAAAVTTDVPEVRWAGFLHDAQKEYAEGRATLALVADGPLPGPADVGVTDTAWLHGLAEAVGECRRHLLDELRHGHVERCEALLDRMDEVYAVLVTMDFPDGITNGLRRATDVTRSIIERTRGDLTVALLQDRLRAALDTHRRAVLDS